MDREVRKEYQVVIQAKDMAGQMGGLSGTTMVNITLTDVNDSPPRFAYSKMSLFISAFKVKVNCNQSTVWSIVLLELWIVFLIYFQVR